MPILGGREFCRANLSGQVMLVRKLKHGEFLELEVSFAVDLCTLNCHRAGCRSLRSAASSCCATNPEQNESGDDPSDAGGRVRHAEGSLLRSFDGRNRLAGAL